MVLIEFKFSVVVLSRAIYRYAGRQQMRAQQTGVTYVYAPVRCLYLIQRSTGSRVEFGGVQWGTGVGVKLGGRNDSRKRSQTGRAERLVRCAKRAGKMPDQADAKKKKKKKKVSEHMPERIHPNNTTERTNQKTKNE